jgi:hypothetical protein
VHLDTISPGSRVRIEQTIQYRDRSWSSAVIGTVRGVRREATGSWFVHAPHGRLCLWRIELQKDDGELTRVVVDDATRITSVPGVGAGGAL